MIIKAVVLLFLISHFKEIDGSNHLKGVPSHANHQVKCVLIYTYVQHAFRHWNSWSSWSQCLPSCHFGFRTRVRSCATRWGVKQCPPGQYDIQPCHGNCRGNPINHAVDGGWSSWSTVTHCSTTCGQGTQLLGRTCTKPAPAFGGRPCVGNPTTTVSCNHHPCRVNGMWSSWGPVLQCSVSCGGGVGLRRRRCNNPAPSHGGHYCRGQAVLRGSCNNQPCQATSLSVSLKTSLSTLPSISITSTFPSTTTTVPPTTSTTVPPTTSTAVPPTTTTVPPKTTTVPPTTTLPSTTTLPPTRHHYVTIKRKRKN